MQRGNPWWWPNDNDDDRLISRDKVRQSVQCFQCFQAQTNRDRELVLYVLLMIQHHYQPQYHQQTAIQPSEHIKSVSPPCNDNSCAGPTLVVCVFLRARVVGCLRRTLSGCVRFNCKCTLHMAPRGWRHPSAMNKSECHPQKAVAIRPHHHTFGE